MASGMVRMLQMEGSDPKTLELADHAAPHGRPRHGAVVELEKRLRESEVYYADSKYDTPPTRHIFGSKIEPITMKGRFRDRDGGIDFAKWKHQEVEAFFSDKRQIEVIWDDVLDVIGLMTRYTGRFESPGEFEYEIEIKIDRDLLARHNPPAPISVKGPRDLTNQIIAALRLKDEIPKTPALRTSIVDMLNGLVGSVNAAGAALVHAAEEIDSFATGTVTALRRFRAGLAQTRAAVQMLRSTYDSLEATFALENEAADNTQPFWDLQAGWAASSLEALRLLAKAERAAAIAEQGTLLDFHHATEGDTWESIAQQYFGSAHRASEIRDYNGVPPGVEPVPGTDYMVPR